MKLHLLIIAVCFSGQLRVGELLLFVVYTKNQAIDNKLAGI